MNFEDKDYKTEAVHAQFWQYTLSCKMMVGVTWYLFLFIKITHLFQHLAPLIIGITLVHVVIIRDLTHDLPVRYNLIDTCDPVWAVVLTCNT